MWLFMAVLSAVFAGVTSILAKCGIKKTDSDVATALRTTVEGLRTSEKAAPERVAYYTQALREVEEMRHDYDL